MKKKNQILLLFLIPFLFFSFASSLSYIEEQIQARENTGSTPSVPKEEGLPAVAKATSTKSAEPLFLVDRVVDGDTLVVNVGGTLEKVRLIGLNTPETVDPRRPVQCFGHEASDKAKEMLVGKSVRLEADSSQDDRDKYGRLLRYVFLSDGTLFNKHMIEEGYGYEYTYRLPYKYQAEFKAAQGSAREKGKGLWAPGVCTQ